MKLSSCLAALSIVLSGTVAADPAPFDLTGPVLTVNVTRAGKTLPLSQVPELAVSDKLAIRADLPADQAAHYLMVVAFLRGATNPPPPEWFIRCETWKAPCLSQGLNVQVPQEAQQVLVLLAPTTTGDFKTLVGAVRGRPGAFVRASQDLNQATLDRSRLDRYMADLRALDGDAARLRVATPLLARSLAVKVDDKCLDRVPSLQIPCLMQDRNSLVLDDGHSSTLVEAITGGPLGNLALDASLTPQASYGYYSPYVASVLDIARIFDSLRIAQYQYIPALSTLRAEHVQLALNAPPSFHNPKSVLVAALPAVEPPQLPPLHAVDPKEIFCAAKSQLVLPVEGAPLVFSTAYAHDVTLRLKAGGKTLELPARADAEQGGYVIDTAAVAGASLGENIRGQLRGMWGFAPYEGPSFQLVNSRAQSWAPASKEETLVVGRDSTLHLTAGSVSCVDSIMLRDPGGKELKTEWKPLKPDEVEVKLPLGNAAPGKLTLLVSRFGANEAQPVEVQAFAEAARLDKFALHAGDLQGVLHGQRLDEVAGLTVHGIAFQPGTLTRSKGSDELAMTAADPQAAAALTAADDKAHVTLKDGRSLDIAASIEPPRPHAALIGRNVQFAAAAESHIHIGNQDEDLPQDAVLTFSVRVAAPASFTRESRIEVATADSAYSVSLASGSGLTFGDAQVAVARLEPAKAFGPAAFGPLRYRVVLADTAGEWQPLAKLVRLPALRELICPEAAELACKLTGTNLFLLQAVAGNPQFEHAVEVPDGFPDLALSVPHPGGHIYVKLRDDPAAVHQAAITARILPPPEPPHPVPDSAPPAESQEHAPAHPPAASQEHAAEASQEHPPAAARPAEGGGQPN